MSGPPLSALLVTDSAPAVVPLLAALRAQGDPAALELVVAAPAAAHPAVLEVAGEGFAAVRLVDADARARGGLNGARIAAIRAASAPVVVFTETHCFPEPGWAAALLAAHAAGAQAAGPAFRNGNPSTATSEAGFLTHYGTFAEPLPPPPWPDLPGHNSSYRRELLLAYGDELTELLRLEYVLHRRMIAEGRPVALVPGAIVRHVNVSRVGAAAREGWLAGRQFGAARAGGWPRARRVAYALAWPLIVPVRMRRHLADARRIGVRVGPRLLVALTLRLTATSAGEAAGYLAGAGEVELEILPMEIHRQRYLSSRDPVARPLLEATGAP